MPASKPPAGAEPAAVRRDGQALVFSGALLRPSVAALWPLARAAVADGAHRLDLRAVSGLDSAGLALLVELAALSGGTLAIQGQPPGLSELGAAYRLTPALALAN